ncbi:hypothetical protein K488DRAFT_86371 [Vararia minispora EC-137]|uniref:Uncharacterized protein n=1 Tax=Vararia minispora EC-137 TaxID=1314806 RepID=A0ACB8QJA8_9AGAM|nr:hypothetical protein K488DRAFT_86371 [Vararia minispora EC-137]
MSYKTSTLGRGTQASKQADDGCTVAGRPSYAKQMIMNGFDAGSMETLKESLEIGDRASNREVSRNDSIGQVSTASNWSGQDIDGGVGRSDLDGEGEGNHLRVSALNKVKGTTELVVGKVCGSSEMVTRGEERKRGER